LQLAAYRRIRKNKEERRPFYIYVDEFQNFATAQFVQMLSEARKYGLAVTMAEQSVSQQDQTMVEVILNNVGTIVSFRTGSSRDEQLMFPHFRPYISEGEIACLPAYNFYVRIRSDETYEPVSGTTLLLNPQDRTELSSTVVAKSRREYGTAKAKEAHPSVRQTSKGTTVPKLSIANKKIEVARRSGAA
jgi:hypothetical protein